MKGYTKDGPLGNLFEVMRDAGEGQAPVTRGIRSLVEPNEPPGPTEKGSGAVFGPGGAIALPVGPEFNTLAAAGVALAAGVILTLMWRAK